MRYILSSVISFILLACTNSDPNTLVIGTIAGPETELVRTAQQVAKQQYGLNVKIVEFTDYNLPNEALLDGTLDANVYQHLPYLKAAIATHDYPFDVIGRTFVYPAGLYSNTFKTVNDLPHHAVIAIPNDPSNEARALLLLQKANLITLKTPESTSLNDIVTNPKQLRFKELDAAQLPRVLEDVDAAVINTSFAIPAGLKPSRDAILIEDKESPYANLIVVRHNNPKQQQLNLFVKALNSPEVERKARELFDDAAIVAW